MSPVQRYSTEQVLRGIQAYFDVHVLGHHTIDPDASVADYCEIVAENDGCPLWFLMSLSRYFGLSWSSGRWGVWLKLPRDTGDTKLSRHDRESLYMLWQNETGKSITVRKLAEYIARHARGVSMEPTTVLGRYCTPAGAFRGLCELPEVRGKRVGPSTKLRDVMGAWKLTEFWGRAEWVSGQPLPKLNIWSIWSDPLPWKWVVPVIAIYVGGSGWVGAFAIRFGMPLWFIAFLSVATFFALAAWIENNRNPLPEGIQTFGDLARLIARRNAEA